MTTTNPRRQCERLWAANKYLVLSHSNKIYLEIRNYLKNDEVSLDQVKAYIDQALDLPENSGQVVNAFQHIWGYFKKKATASEKEKNLNEQMIQNIAKGRLAKFFKEVCLLDQEYIWDKTKTVAQFLNEVEKGLTVTDFKRFTLRAE